MGLISKEVEIRLSNANIKHFEKLGYKIPMKLSSESTYIRYGNRYVVDKDKKIKVNVKDLKETSKVKVLIKCDCCGKEYESCYSDYKNHNHDGKTYCNKCKGKIFLSGNKNHGWREDITQEERENMRTRNYNPKYTELVKKVMARDNCTCKCCGKYQGDIIVHHLDGYNWCKEKRTDETNCVILCDSCHKNFHSVYGKGNNTKEQFEEWIGYAIGELEKYNGELPTARKVYCIEEDKVYDSAKELSKEWVCDHTYIYDVCNHKNKKYNRNGVIKTTECKTVKGKHLIWLSEAIEKGYIAN